MRITLALALILLFTTSAAAQRQRYCDGHTPYYHDTKNEPGAFIADLFFFPTTTVVAVPAVALTGDGHVFCTPAAHAANLIRKKRRYNDWQDQRGE